MSKKTYVGDVGTEIILDAKTDISLQTTLEIHYEKPSGITGEWTAAVDNENFARYVTQVDDLDEAGVWRFRIYIILPTWTGYGEEDQTKVYDLEW